MNGFCDLCSYLVEVQSGGCPTSATQGPNYLACYRVEIVQDRKQTNVIISAHVDYKKTVFQESKVDKRVSERIKKFYVEQFDKIDHAILKLKDDQLRDDIDEIMTLKQVMKNWVYSLNIDEVVLTTLVCISLANLYMFMTFIISSLK